MTFLGATHFLQLGFFELHFTSFCNCMLQSWIADFEDLLLLVFSISGSSVEIAVHCK